MNEPLVHSRKETREAHVRTIAIEEHFTTPLYREYVSANEFRNFYLTSRSKQVGYDIAAQNSDLGSERLFYMNDAGIDVQVLSFGSPGAQAFEAQIAIPMARDANDRLFKAILANPGRFAGFAALPTAAPEAAADELERCITEYGFKGTMIHGHTRGHFLDEKEYWVIFERAEKLRVPIYLHPTYPHPAVVNAYFDGYEDLARAAWGFQIDSSCHFLRIVFSGVFDAFPSLKIILGHLGEALPFAMHRLNDHTYQSARHRGLKKEPLQYFMDNMLVTTSGNWHLPSFMCTFETLGADRIFFAVDWPYEPNRTGVDFLHKLPISDMDREKISHLNAENLFGL
jgi:predicted TIM-barrel fold metal-dependent hydrolase